MTERSEKRKREHGLPKYVEEENHIGSDAADHTSGVPETPEEWAAKQPLSDGPTYPLEPGDPSPLQPAAGTPEAQEPVAAECEEDKAPARR